MPYQNIFIIAQNSPSMSGLESALGLIASWLTAIGTLILAYFAYRSASHWISEVERKLYSRISLIISHLEFIKKQLANADKNIVIATIVGNSELKDGSPFYIISKKIEEILLIVSENKIIWKDKVDNFINEKDIEGSFCSLSIQMLAYSTQLKELSWDKKLESLEDYLPELNKDIDNLILLFKQFYELILKEKSYLK